MIRFLATAMTGCKSCEAKAHCAYWMSGEIVKV